MAFESNVPLGERIAQHAHATSAMGLAELHSALQVAIELEHATIPAYLFALYSIKPGANAKAAAIIQSVVAEEMLHMALAANILNAIGGRPRIDHPGFVPAYPCTLPLGPQQNLLVPLAPCSKPLIHDVFMAIEQPEWLEGGQKGTLGAFYGRIGQAIERLGEGIFTGEPARQVAGPLRGELLFAVESSSAALHAIEEIIDQGEGAGPREPRVGLGKDAGGDELAHYYRFGEIFAGRRARVRDGSVVYDGAVVPFDGTAIWPVQPNPIAGQLAAGSAARLRADYFNLMYSNLLRVLHRTFNGEPHQLDRAVGMMFALKLQAQELMATPIDPSDPGSLHAGPSFAYVPADGARSPR